VETFTSGPSFFPKWRGTKSLPLCPKVLTNELEALPIIEIVFFPVLGAGYGGSRQQGEPPSPFFQTAANLIALPFRNHC